MEQKIRDIVGKYLFKPNVKETIDDMTKEIQKYVNSLNLMVSDVKVNKDTGAINVSLKKWFDTLYNGEDKVVESAELDLENGSVKIKPIKAIDSLKLDIDFDSIFKDFDEMLKGFVLSKSNVEDFIQLNPTNEILVSTIGEYIDLDYLETEEYENYKSLKCGVEGLFEFEIIERKDRSVYFISEGDKKASMHHSHEDALKSLEKFFEYTNQHKAEKNPDSESIEDCCDEFYSFEESKNEIREILELEYVISKATKNGWKYEQNVIPMTGPRNYTWEHVFTKGSKCWYSNSETMWFPSKECPDSKVLYSLDDLLFNLVGEAKDPSPDDIYKMGDELIKAGFIKNGKFLSKNGISVQPVTDASGTYYLYDGVKIQQNSDCARLIIQAAQNAGYFKKIYSM